MFRFWARRRVASHKHAKRTICNNCRDEIGPDIHLVTTKRGLLGSPGRCHKILGPFTKGIIIGSIYDNYDTEPRKERSVKEASQGETETPGRINSSAVLSSRDPLRVTDPYDRVEEALQELEAEA